MTLLSLVMAPHQALRTPANLIDKIDDILLEIVENLRTLMQEFSLLGISAPMIGVSKQLVIVNLSSQESFKNGEDFCIIMNPKILNVSSEMGLFKESSPCFSGVDLELKRFSEIELEYQNLQGEKIIKNFYKGAAAIIQHHLDILEGKSFFDQLSSLKKKIIFDRLLQRKKRSYAPHVHGPHCQHS